MDYTIQIIFLFLFFMILSSALMHYFNSNKKKNKLLKEWDQKPTNPMNREKVEAFYKEGNFRLNTADVLDDYSWHDFDLDEVYKKMDACDSSIGRQALYQILHEVNADTKKLHERKELFEKFSQTNTRKQMLYEFYKIGRNDYHQLFDILSHPAKLFLPIPFLSILSLAPSVFLILSFFSRVFIMGLLVSLLINTFVYFYSSRRERGRLQDMQYFNKIAVGAKQISHLVEGSLQERLKEESKLFRTGFDFSFFSGESEAGIVAQYLSVFFLLNVQVYYRLQRRLEKHKNEAKQMLRDVGEIEALLYVWKFTQSKQTCQVAHTEEGLKFDQLYHPLLKKPIKYSMNPYRSTLLTGSNASGKSTFLKSLALSLLFGMNFDIAFSDSFVFKKGLVLSSMQVQDSITESKSYFLMEIERIHSIIEKSKEEYSYIFIDELLRGTNTTERIGASIAILEQLSKTNSCVSVATHDLELTEIVKGYDFYHFREEYKDDDIFFDYVLHPGPSRTRNGIKLLEKVGFDVEIIQKAKKEVDYFQSHHHWRKSTKA